jgi:hypothetical protein
VEIPCCPNAWKIDSDVEGSSQLWQGPKRPPLWLPQPDVIDVVDCVEIVEVELRYSTMSVVLVLAAAMARGSLSP